MSFPRYPAYKDSGVEWLGEVPEHWNLVPIKRILQSIEQGWSPQCEAGPAEFGEWGVLKVGCVNGGKFNPDENKALPRELLPDERLAIRSGDVLVSRANTRELVGSVAMAEMDYPNILLCDKLYRLRTNQAACFPAFLARYLVSDRARNVIETSASGASSSMLNIGQSVIVNMPIALPPAREQADVVHFLDRETAKIDALIAEQQRLIELLQEKRQAVISHAVTKGLNPDAPMKDSGVEWLGEVPEHWEVWKLSQLCEGIGSGTTPKSDIPEFYEDGAIPWVVTGDLNDSVLAACSNHVTDMAVAQHSALRLYEAGSVVVAMYGATIGKAAVLGVDATVNQACCVIPPDKKIAGKFLLLFFLSARSYLLSLATGGGQPNINQEAVRSIRLPLPPLTEQQAIVQQVEAGLGALDSVASLATVQVELLQERRSALISAAVTGQIDVRGLAPEASAA